MCQPSAAPLAVTVAGCTHLSPSCGLGSGDPIRASSTDLCPGGQGTHVLPLSLACGNLFPTRESDISRERTLPNRSIRIEYSHPMAFY